MSKILITSDLHLTDQVNDFYRFEFLKYLVEFIQTESITNTFFLGDHTDRKNNHSAELVNTIVEHLVAISEHSHLHLLAGNHDSVSEDCPYFLFINKGFENITFYKTPTQIGYDKTHFGNVYPVLILPFARDSITAWADLEVDPKTKLIFMHQTITGSKASNGMIMEGLSTEFLHTKFGKTPIISGDIHVPQTIGPVTYVGSPYHVHFGDHSFTPRFMTLDTKTGKTTDHFYPNAPKKVRLTIHNPSDLTNYEFKEFDQIKIDLKLHKSDWVQHEQHKTEIKEFCDKNNLLLKGIMITELDSKTDKDQLIKHTKREDVLAFTPEKVFDNFCAERKIDNNLIQLGKSFL